MPRLSSACNMRDVIKRAVWQITKILHTKCPYFSNSLPICTYFWTECSDFTKVTYKDKQGCMQYFLYRTDNRTQAMKEKQVLQNTKVSNEQTQYEFHNSNRWYLRDHREQVLQYMWNDQIYTGPLSSASITVAMWQVTFHTVCDKV